MNGIAEVLLEIHNPRRAAALNEAFKEAKYNPAEVSTRFEELANHYRQAQIVAYLNAKWALDMAWYELIHGRPLRLI